MAALGWYQVPESGVLVPTDAPPSVYSGADDPFFPFPTFRGGVIGASSGTVVWTVLWNNSTTLSDRIAGVTTDNSTVEVSFDVLESMPIGVLTIGAADANGALIGKLRLTCSSGMPYGSFAWDVTDLAPDPEPAADFWTNFISSYEVP